jgi:molecular chaperone HtpG
MATVEIPTKLSDLLSGSEIAAPTVEFADLVGTTLSGGMPFFPAYTDHGTQHVERVLSAAVRLVPDEVWEKGLLQATDGAVLICATLLHDLAMYVHEQGFVELVGEDTRYKPRPWFSEAHVDRPADIPWPDLWRAFQREARHFGTSQIELLFGRDNEGVPAVAHDENPQPSKWTTADRLLIGEFLRRHHARLAHEIALNGFPGTNPDDFPVLADRLPTLADAVGAVARSHNESLRCMLEYMDYLSKGSVRPAGALLVFHMGLLRVADYLQVEAHRAPPLLLRLKAPVSPLSVEEWDKHGAISSVSWEHSDSSAIDVTVSSSHGLRTHLALRELFADMQNELDTTSAVLGEVYATDSLQSVRLAYSRVRTNLDEPGLHDQLPYLPRRAALQSDPDLFRLVIRDLYGNQPAVAGRELIQNAVDAVRARRAMEKRSGEAIPGDRLREQEGDVVVTLEESGNGSCVLHVADRGIGMAPDLVVDYYLKAGASFGPTSGEIKDLNRADAMAAMKAGRFGVGAFAAFLLGPEIEVTTRHADEERGVSFRARIDEDLVQLDWVDDLPVGTEVKVAFDGTRLPAPSFLLARSSSRRENLLRMIRQFYRLSDPSVAFVHHTNGAEPKRLLALADVPVPQRRLPDSWRRVNSSGMDSVIWQVPRDTYESSHFLTRDGGAIIHNGILIREPRNTSRDGGAFGWSDTALGDFLRRPDVAVFDSRHSLGVALHRYSLVDRTLPFERQLIESIGADLVAHALIVGARNHPLQALHEASPVFSRHHWMPLLPSLLRQYAQDRLLVLWCPNRSHDSPPFYPSEPQEFIPPDEFLAPDGVLPWSRFPQRAYATLENSGYTGPRRAERDRWGFTLSAVGGSVKDLAASLGALEVTTVVLRRDGLGAKGRQVKGLPSNRDPSEEPGLFLVGNDPFDYSPLDPTDSKLAGRLAETAEALHAAGPWRSVVLSAFGGIARRSPQLDLLGSSWAKAIDGGLGRAPDKREATAEEILAKIPELRPFTNKWRRLLTAQEKRSREN